MLSYSNMLAAEQSANFGPPSLVRSKSCVSAAAGCPFRPLATPLRSFVPFEAAVDVHSRHLPRNRAQLITCKAGPSGRKADDGASVQIPQSEEESVRTSTILLVPSGTYEVSLQLNLACMQITQAIAALSIKMGQGKKGGKPTKVSLFTSSHQGTSICLGPVKGLSCWMHCHAFTNFYIYENPLYMASAGLQEWQPETTQCSDSSAR